jgi:hypothetical protein
LRSNEESLSEEDEKQYKTVGQVLLDLLLLGHSEYDVSRVKNDLINEIGSTLQYFPYPQILSKVLDENTPPFFQDLNNTPKHDHLFILEELSATPAARQLLFHHISDTLRFFSRRLELLSKTFVQQHGANNVQEYVRQAEETLKKLVVLQDRLHESIREQVKIFTEHNDKKSETYVGSLLNSILAFLQSNLWKREITCTTGLSFSLFIADIIDILVNRSEITDQEKHQLAAKEIVTNFFEPEFRVVDIQPPHNSSLSASIPQVNLKECNNLPPLSRLMILRGFLLALPSSVLVSPIDLITR